MRAGPISEGNRLRELRDDTERAVLLIKNTFQMTQTDEEALSLIDAIESEVSAMVTDLTPEAQLILVRDKMKQGIDHLFESIKK